MKLCLLMVALAGALLPLAGCETLADTKGENMVRVRHAMQLNMKQIPNDFEYIMYLDRPVWLSRYPIPND